MTISSCTYQSSGSILITAHSNHHMTSSSSYITLHCTAQHSISIIIRCSEGEERFPHIDDSSSNSNHSSTNIRSSFTNSSSIYRVLIIDEMHYHFMSFNPLIHCEEDKKRFRYIDDSRAIYIDYSSSNYAT